MAFRAFTDLEAQPQNCAWSTIPALNHGSVLSRHDDPPSLSSLNRGSAPSRHDDPPLPSGLPCPNDPPPAYTPYYPPPPISGSDPSEFATNRRVDGHYLIAIVIAFIMIVALFATAVYFTFFNHSKA
ncbi:hypothetical protein BGY98DRAFT_930671 [Russula aff. rugulosa BPL654]|nr:hypothetical protein BGY98DRAFT_930671 [Russula aff. rugulosa BPL654]